MTTIWRDHKALIISGLLCLLMVAFYFICFERIPRELDMGYGEGARKNPFLAAEQLAESLRKPHRQVRSLSALEDMSWQGEPIPQHATLILQNSFQALSESQFQALWQWVENGGTLVFHSENPFIDPRHGSPDRLFTLLGLTLAEEQSGQLYRGDEDKSPEASSATPEPSLDKDNPPKPQQDLWQDAPSDEKIHCKTSIRRQSVNIPNAADAMEVNLNWGRGFSQTEDATWQPQWWSGPTEQGVIAGYSVEQGNIIVISSLLLWQNPHIACFDHAYLLTQLIAPADALWILRNEDAPSLWQQLWQFLPQTLLAFGAALCAWLWQKGKRFGRIKNGVPRPGRAFIEHLRANGEWLWRHKQCGPVVEQLRSNTLRRLQQRFPSLSPAEQCEMLANLTALPIEAIESALFNSYQHNAQHFIRVMAHLNIIRNSL